MKQMERIVLRENAANKMRLPNDSTIDDDTEDDATEARARLRVESARNSGLRERSRKNAEYFAC